MPSVCGREEGRRSDGGSKQLQHSGAGYPRAARPIVEARLTRLRRSDPTGRGWSRRRIGRGFGYFDEDGRGLDAEGIARCKSLVIPPAWESVWICPLPNGHIQAIGTDARGRRQYLYHPDWRARRDIAKHDRVLRVAQRLPAARRSVTAALNQPGMSEERALATAFRLLDLGYFRIGSDSYASENGSFGLTTLERRHVQRHGKLLLFEFEAKSGISQHVEIIDPQVLASVETMRRRRSGPDQLLCFRNGGHWKRLEAEHVNAYLKDLLHDEVSAKDFRTWHGTVHAAVALAQLPAESRAARRRSVAAAMREVAHHLGNTPTVARASYVDERVIDRYLDGTTIAGTLSRMRKLPLGDIRRTERTERAVLRLIRRGH